MKTSYLILFTLCFSFSIALGQQNQTTTKTTNATPNSNVPKTPELIPFTEMGDLWGYKNAKTDKVIIEPAYYEAFPFSFGLALVRDENSKTGFINTLGEKVIPMIYDGGFSFTEGLAAMNSSKGFDGNNSFVSGKWGFIDVKGNVVIPFHFTDAKPFSQNLAAVATNEIWGFIDKTAKLIIPKKYGQANSFKEGLAAVRNYDKWGYINKSGATIIAFKYDYAEDFENGIAKVEINGKNFNINKKGEQVK